MLWVVMLWNWELKAMMTINYRKMFSILALALNFNVIVAQAFSKLKLCKFLLNFSLMTFIRISILCVYILNFHNSKHQKLWTLTNKQNVYLCLCGLVTLWLVFLLWVFLTVFVVVMFCMWGLRFWCSTKVPIVVIFQSFISP